MTDQPGRGLTREEFEAAYSERAGMTIEKLRYFGRFAEPCDCGYTFCEGWAMGHQHDDALFEASQMEATP